jgi:hypothetical protein
MVRVLVRPRPRLSRLVTGLLTATLAALLSAAPALLPSAEAAVTRPFTAWSPWNATIKSQPALDPSSSAMVAQLTREGRMYSNLVAYGIPVYTATSTTPRYAVTCDMEGTWGACPLSRQPMPIPDGAQPSAGDDGVLTVIDPDAGTVGEYWQARRTGTGWAASFGAVNSLSGSGWGGSSTGSGASRLAGVIRVEELERHWVGHALALQTDNVCAGTVRSPALKTDGVSTRADCVPEGARLQLDPGLDLTTLRLSPAEFTVARAMQVYGGYVMDRSGTSLSVSFERAPDAGATTVGSVYTAAGLRWDYDGLEHVPWNRLRVLGTWQG